MFITNILFLEDISSQKIRRLKIGHFYIHVMRTRKRGNTYSRIRPPSESQSPNLIQHINLL